MKENDKIVVFVINYEIQLYSFRESGLGGFDDGNYMMFSTENSRNEPDGTYPNSKGYKQFYVPQLIKYFEDILKWSLKR